MRTWQMNRRTGLLALAVGAVLLLTNVALFLQNIELKAKMGGHGDAGFLQPGDSVPMLRGIGMSGEDIAIRYGPTVAEQTLLLVFAPGCSWCARNMGNWEAIVRAAEARRFRVVAVSTYNFEVAKYVTQHPFLRRLPVIAEIDARDLLAYKLRSTPQTLVIDRNGVIKKVWLGALALDQQAEAEAYFGIKLPGARGPAGTLSTALGG